MNLSGQLNIHMHLDKGAVNASLVVDRPPFLQRLVQGKNLAQGISEIPMLFNVCRRAQAVTAARAAEQVLQITARDTLEQSRDRLVRLEMLHEHLWSLFVTLPRLLELDDQSSSMANASQQLQALMKQLDRQNTLTSIATHDHILQPDLWLTEAQIKEIAMPLFGDTRPSLELETLENSRALAGELLKKTKVLDWSTALEVRSSQPLDTELFKLLDKAQDLSEFFNSAFAEDTDTETSPLTRSYGHPMVQASRELHGNGVTTRLVALIVETAQLLWEPEELKVACGSAAPLHNTGIASLETARGRLIHAITLREDDSANTVIEKFLLLSPTDWNFQSNGIAARLLSELANSQSSQLNARAELLIGLINPCMAHQVKWSEKSNASRNNIEVCYA